MRVIDEINDDIYYVYNGEKLQSEVAELTEFGMDEGQLYDNYPGGIPNWSVCYKGNKKNKIENDNI
ncbi:MAG: hypothetical protein LUG60_03825 [Erysipelotrichaceae bacterium]|nr:hypothetical protein [Erysipelotrichaceae bacterium]